MSKEDEHRAEEIDAELDAADAAQDTATVAGTQPGETPPTRLWGQDVPELAARTRGRRP